MVITKIALNTYLKYLLRDINNHSEKDADKTRKTIK